MTSSLPHLAGIVLAAGGSRRLGRPKQLLVYRGEMLVQRAVAAALSVCGAGVTVVTGESAGQTRDALGRSPANIVYNPDWKDGLSTSVRAAMAEIPSRGIDGVLISLCDQPLVTAEDLASLADVWQTSPDRPAAASYASTLGVPAIFPPAYFAALMELSGDAGARSVLQGAEDISVVSMPGAALDVDTESDLEELLRRESGD
jgi:molybdenum cofactor cytidylyltransferase